MNGPEAARAALRIGPIELATPVVLAPMAGVTNAPFRTLCRRSGAGLYVGEMITARAYLEDNEKTRRLASFAEDESPRSLQLYGVDAHHVGEAVRRLVDEDHVDHVDLNFGCPVPKVTRCGGGAALPVRRRLLRSILAAAVRAAGAVPVTAKFRMGIDDDHLLHVQTGRIAEDEGCAAVALHARTAEQCYAGDARWWAIGELKEAVTSIPVLGNGDVWEAADAIRMVAETGCDGVVVGRGCLGRPWLFAELAAAFGGFPAPRRPDLGQVAEVMIEHFDLLAAWSPAMATREFRKHTGWYLRGYRVGGEVRQALNQLQSRRHLVDLLATLDPTQEMTPEGVRAKRGHTHGPRRVVLPDGWYDSADSDEALADGAEAAGSGG